VIEREFRNLLDAHKERVRILRDNWKGEIGSSNKNYTEI